MITVALDPVTESQFKRLAASRREDVGHLAREVLEDFVNTCNGDSSAAIAVGDEMASPRVPRPHSPAVPDRQSDPDFQSIVPCVRDYLSNLGNMVVRLSIHVQMQEMVAAWLERLWPRRKQVPVAAALVAIEAALRHTDEPDIDQAMAGGLAEILTALRADMPMDEARGVGTRLNQLCFALWPQSGGEAAQQDM